jgi:hypothetical protein
VLGASLTDYQGTWEGYAEAYEWDDQSDLVRIQLDGDGNGTLRVGKPDTKPLDPGPEPGLLPDFKPNVYTLSAGFSYPIDGATVTSRRIRISTSSQVVWKDWCSSFEPIADPNNVGNFSCVSNVGWSYDQGDGCRLMDAQRTPIDCANVHCMQVCACTDSSCNARIEHDDVQIDAALMADGDELNGTLLSGNERINIRMLRTP